MKHILKSALAILLTLCMCACRTSSAEPMPQTLQEQSVAQLQLLETMATVETTTVCTTTVTTETTTVQTTTDTTTETTVTTETTTTEATTTEATTTTTTTTAPVVTDKLAVRAIWIPASDLNNMLSGQSEAGFRKQVQQQLTTYQQLGINTVFLHVRSFGDAYYNSALFPRAAGWSTTQRFDPLAIFLAEAHARGLGLHAWVNPLRCQTASQMSALAGSWQTKAWVNAKSSYMVQVGGRWYLNPAYAEVRALICAGVSEILAKYAVDGIHIDDYFYPTTDTGFDAAAFQKSGCSSLAAWRTANIDLLVAAMYKTTHTGNAARVFSVSPCGNPEENRTRQYANVKRWCSESGFANWMIPQLYYGFFHETLPFVSAAKQWQAMTTCSSVQLIFGIATYKIGENDAYAGTGAAEWTTDTLIPARQILFARELKGVTGVALFSSATTRAAPKSELEAIRQALCGT